MLFTAVMIAGILMPPAKYDHEPRSPYEVHYVSPAKITDTCPRSLSFLLDQLKNPAAFLGGCVELEYSPARIWIDRTLTKRQRALTLRHEKAHINGWKHGHAE